MLVLGNRAATIHSQCGSGRRRTEGVTSQSREGRPSKGVGHPLTNGDVSENTVCCRMWQQAHMLPAGTSRPSAECAASTTSIRNDDIRCKAAHTQGSPHKDTKGVAAPQLLNGLCLDWSCLRCMSIGQPAGQACPSMCSTARALKRRPLLPVTTAPTAGEAWRCMSALSCAAIREPLRPSGPARNRTLAACSGW